MAYAPASLHSLAVGSDATRYQEELMEAITDPQANVVAVRNILWDIPKELRRSVLLTPSVSTRHKLRTPLMAAAATSQMPIVGRFGSGLPRGVAWNWCEPSCCRARMCTNGSLHADVGRNQSFVQASNPCAKQA